MKNRIPKIINYCWFGGNPLPDLAKNCINSWKKYCPDYEIVEWNESNFDINCCDYVKEAYESKKWAFVSDYARLWIIYHNGGIYLDTDVELVKSLDDFLGEKCYLGVETSGYINTGLGFGAEPNNEIVKLMLDEYDNRHYRSSNGIYDTIPCPKRNTEPLKKLGYVYKEQENQRIGGALILSPEYLCPMDYESGNLLLRDHTYSIHHYSASWISQNDIEVSKHIHDIMRKNGKVIGQIKKQYYLYSLQKNEGNTKGFLAYMISKVKFKIMKR